MVPHCTIVNGILYANIAGINTTFEYPYIHNTDNIVICSLPKNFINKPISTGNKKLNV